MPDISPSSGQVEEQPPAENAIAPAEVLAALQRILSSPDFANAARSRDFLQFVVAKTVAGEGDTIKEYLIGAEAFGRPSDYDPRNDPIVRVEAGRLRSRLADYYSGSGANDLIRIDLPKGSYVPVFSRRNGQVSAPSLSTAEPHALVDTAAAPLFAGAKTMPRRRQWPWVLAVAALAAILCTTIYLQIRKKRAVPLTSRDSIVLADFTNSTGEAVFDGTLQQALILQLSKSPFIEVLSPARVRETLTQMGRPANSPVTREVAREICQRTADKLVLQGSIDRLGTEYVVGLRALNCATGEQVAGDQERAARKEKVLDALAGAAGGMRGRLGESLATVQSKWVQPGTSTPSLEALKFYSDGIDAQNSGTDASSIPFFNRAIELDPNFAVAYAALGMVYRDMGEEGLSNQNFTKAFELRSSSSEVESFRISAFYYSYVTGELLKANEYYQLWADRYPNDAVPHANWAINCNALGEYDKAIKESLEALRIEPGVGPALGNLVGFYTSVKRLDKAKETYDLALSRKLDGIAVRGNRYGVAFLEKDNATMESLLKWAADKPGVNDLFLSLQADTDAFYGHLQQARNGSDRATESALRNGLKESAALRLLDSALREVEFGNPELARSQANRALSLAPTPSVQILAAVILARSGDTATARKLLSSLEKRYPLNTPFNGYWLPTIHAAIFLASKAPADAVEALEAASPYELGQPDPTVGVGGLLYPVYLRGQAYLKLGKGAQAAAEFQKVLDAWGIVQNAPFGALARLGMGRAQAMMGDNTAARTSYNDFFVLWKDADPDIPVLRTNGHAKLR